jgi:CDP-diacylglycerol--glycerol-3-phosphate 3-phosphatidyltransferase/cardiolipin synthase
MDVGRPIAGIVFGIAAITDMLDGYVARKLGQTSRFGEFLDPVLREWMAGLGEREQVKVSVAGKVKTTLQMFGIAFMVYQKDLFGMELYTIGFILLLAAAGMTLWSMIVYLRAAWPSMQRNA